jgi:hypothetical protein
MKVITLDTKKMPSNGVEAITMFCCITHVIDINVSQQSSSSFQIPYVVYLVFKRNQD